MTPRSSLKYKLQMQKDIQALAAKWSLKFNPNKCGLLRFWNDSTETNYQLNNATITLNSSIKDLGTTISNDLSWTSHYKSIDIIAKGYKSLGLIHRTFTTNSIDAKKAPLYIFSSFTPNVLFSDLEATPHSRHHPY